MFFERVEFLKQWNEFVINVGDEEVWLEWITYAIPDEPTEEDFEFIAKDDDEWKRVVNIFANILTIYG